jgi:hypothetical protein
MAPPAKRLGKGKEKGPKETKTVGAVDHLSFKTSPARLTEPTHD